MSLLESPAAARNRQPIFDAVDPRLPADARVLEVASGTGQHVAFFASRRPDTRWQPSDRDDSAFTSIEGWIEREGATNAARPILLDVCDSKLPDESFDAVYCANMIHIAPWAACIGLIALAGSVLRSGGRLFLYGPFFVAGEPTAPSNTAFDQDLRRRDPEWGIRDLEHVETTAEEHGLALIDRIPMPANNQLVVFERR